MTSNSTTQDRLVIFLHLPKTGGTTLSTIIERQYKPNHIFSFNYYVNREFIDQLHKIPETSREKIQVIQGHMGFGIHQYLNKKFSYIVLLRDPVDRIISHYYYLLQTPSNPIYQFIKFQQMSLKEYVLSRMSLDLENGQTRLLSGMEGELDHGSCTEEMLERAKFNLREYFSVAGLTEEFDRTLLIMKRTFGWKETFYTKQNKTKKRPLKAQICPETKRIIEKYNELDIELYNYAKERFQELVKSQNSSFERELKKFQSLNRSYGNLYSLSCLGIQKVRRNISKYKW